MQQVYIFYEHNVPENILPLTKRPSFIYSNPEIYRDYTHDPLLFSVAQGIIWLSSERLTRSTLHLIEGGRGESALLYIVVLLPCCPASTPLWG